MANGMYTNNYEVRREPDFLEYWTSLGLFDSMQFMLPPQFMVLFEIARNIFTEEKSKDALTAIDEMTRQERVLERDRDESIQINREDRVAPVSDRMELDNFKRLVEMRNILPRELAQDNDVFDIKLLTKTLIVQKFYEGDTDNFKPISMYMDERGQEQNRLEQKFYILLDRSRSMEVRMRSFYSKCIVAEFLRRKLQTHARLYYRPFDTTTGDLIRVERREDFPRLIEEVLLTTTGGRSTNLQAAIYQAIDDIRYDKEMANTEILVVTDGISRIDKYEAKERLGDIKLNILKIGRELAEGNFYDLKSTLERQQSKVDPTFLSMKNVQYELNKYKSDKEDSNLTAEDERSYKILMEYSQAITKELHDVAHKFIEIEDFHEEGLYQITQDNLDRIKDAVARMMTIDISRMDLIDKERFYKQVYLYNQYLGELLKNNPSMQSEIQSCLDKMVELKDKLFRDPELLFTLMEVDKFDEDKKRMKLAKKDAKRLMKEMQMSQKDLSIREMRKAQLMFTGDMPSGGKEKASPGQFILLMIIKLLQLLKWLILLPLAPFRKKKDGEEE